MNSTEKFARDLKTLGDRDHWTWTVIWENDERDFPTKAAALDFAEKELPALDPDADHVTVENSAGTRSYEWDIERD
jgi:hypothetical protein